MAIRKIARMGHPVLRTPADPVADPTAPEIRRLVEDMLETLAEERGTGLAAPQVFVSQRIVVFFVARGEEQVPMTVLINPLLEPLGPEQDFAYEGCLSLPGLSGMVPRFERIRYSGLDLSGQLVTRTASGFHARVVQHECEHLDGVLYPMRMTDLGTFGFAEEIYRVCSS